MAHNYKKYINVTQHFKQHEGVITNAKGEACQKVLDGEKIITQKILQLAQPALDNAWKDALNMVPTPTQSICTPPYVLPPQHTGQHDDPSFPNAEKPYAGTQA